MELFAEKLTNNKFLILIALGLVEIIGFIILFVSYKSLYLNVFEETKVISLNKTLEIAYSFYNVFSIYINRYIQDVKLIGRHMSFLSNEEININSHYYQKIKNNSDKNFIKGTLENLESNDIIEQIYIDNNFSYFNVYAEKYINNADIKVNILNELMNKTKHPELNSIAFINQNGKIEGESEMIAKYLISILKTNILKRFIVEGEQFEIKNYILINKDALYIYPPKPLSRSLIYPMINKYTNIKNDTNSDFFGKYIYDYLINKIPKISYDSMIVNISFVNVDKDYIEGALCLNIPFNKKLDYFDSIICIEVNLTKMFGDELFEEKEGFSAMFIIDIEGYIRPLYSDKKRIFDDIKTILNHKEKYQKYPLYNKTYNLFYFLYNDLLTQPDLLDKYNISLDNIYKEYQIIHNTTLICLGHYNDIPEASFDIRCEGYITNTRLLSLYYSASDFLITPSYQEAFSQTPLESMACGTPVIAFPFSGTSETICPSNGIICADFTEEALILAIKEAITRHYDRDIIRQKVIDRFSYKIIGNQYKKLYEQSLLYIS